jgi:putative Ca2+/H+ antiporter (TMEM165/GDT1 family)
MKNNSVMSDSVSDIQTTWKVIAGMAAATVLIALIYITLLRWFVKPLLYISMVLILVCFILFGTWSFMKRSEFDATTQKKNYDYATAGAGIGWGLAALYFCFMCCCWKNISLGASIMEAAS